MATEKLVRPKDEAALVRSVVNGILDGRAEAHQALNSVPPEAFAGWLHRDLWESVLGLVKSGNPPDFPAIERQLHQTGKLTGQDSWTRYENILSEGSGWEDETKLASAVLSLYQRRELIKAYQKAAEEAGNLLLDHLETAQTAMSHTLNVISGGADDPEAMGSAIVDAVTGKMKFCDDQEAKGKLVQFGISTLDKPVEEGGVSIGPGQLAIIAGRPGNYKTTWACHVLGSTAMMGNESLFISLELSKWEVRERMAAWFTNCKRFNFKHGTYTEFQTGRLTSQKPTMDLIHGWYPARATWSRLEAKIRGAALKGIKVVVIDHFGLISKEGLRLPPGAKDFDMKRYIAERLRELCKELQIAVVLLAQLNREIEKGKAPGMENLRETGALEEVAYLIIILWHEEKEGNGPSLSVGPDAPPPSQDQFKYTVVKHRDGKSFFTKKINPDGATCHIMEME